MIYPNRENEIDLIISHSKHVHHEDKRITISFNRTYPVRRIRLVSGSIYNVTTSYNDASKQLRIIPDNRKLEFDRPEPIRFISFDQPPGEEQPVLEVIADESGVNTAIFKDKYRLNPSFLTNNFIVGSPDISAIRVTRVGDLGNYVSQIAHSIIAAKRCGASKVELFDQGSIRVPEVSVYDGLEIVRYDPGSSNAQDGTLCGPFFRKVQYGRLLSEVGSVEIERIAKEFIRPFLLAHSPVDDVKLERELTVHLRSGDIFRKGFLGGHGQPPLAFYRKAVGDRIAEFNLERVRLVFQDRGNPIIGELIHEFTELGLEFRCQSSSETDDFWALVDADHLIVGFSGFPNAAAVVSTRIQSVTYFETQHPFSLQFEDISAVQVCHRYVDVAGGYPPPSAWRNTSSDNFRLLSYPQHGIISEISAEDQPRSAPMMARAVEVSSGKVLAANGSYRFDLTFQGRAWVLLAFSDDREFYGVDIELEEPTPRKVELEVRTSIDSLRWTDPVSDHLDAGTSYIRARAVARFIHVTATCSRRRLRFRIKIFGRERVIPTHWGYYAADAKQYHLTHNAGLFSQIICALTDILYINSLCFTVCGINTDKSYDLYRDDDATDVHRILFSGQRGNQLAAFDSASFKKSALDVYSAGMDSGAAKWFASLDYERIPFDLVQPLIVDIFSPSEEVIRRAAHLVQTYSIDVNNTLCIYVRATDKAREVELAELSGICHFASKILRCHPGMRVLVQSDDVIRRDAVLSLLGSRAFSIDDSVAVFNGSPMHLRPEGDRTESAMKFLSIFSIMVKCKVIVATVSNVSTAMSMYRGGLRGMAIWGTSDPIVDCTGATADF